MKGFRKLHIKPNIPVENARFRKQYEKQLLLQQAGAAMLTALQAGATQEQARAAFNRVIHGEPEPATTPTTEQEPQ